MKNSEEQTQTVEHWLEKIETLSKSGSAWTAVSIAALIGVVGGMMTNWDTLTSISLVVGIASAVFEGLALSGLRMYMKKAGIIK